MKSFGKQKHFNQHKGRTEENYTSNILIKIYTNGKTSNNIHGTRETNPLREKQQDP